MASGKEKRIGFEQLKRSVIYQDLCTRCGGCAASCPVNALSFGKDGIELVGDCIECGTCYRICPGKGMDLSSHERRLFGASRKERLGKVRGIFKTKKNLVASDREILKAGYFGGRVSAVLINALGTGAIDAALLTDWSDEGHLSIGQARVARNREDVLRMASSKYVFSPVLTLIRDVQEDASINNVAVVGLPCHIEAMRNMEMDPVASRMMKKVRYIIGLNCGAPNMSERDWKTFVSETFAVSEDKIQGFRARKTGKRSIEMSLVMVGGCERTKAISINAYLKHFERSPKWPRCSLCPDYSADLSDVTFGLPLIRTEKGEELVGSAVENGYLKKGSISRAIVQKYLDVYVGYGKRRRTRKGIGLRKKEGSPYPEYR